MLIMPRQKGSQATKKPKKVKAPITDKASALKAEMTVQGGVHYPVNVHSSSGLSSETDGSRVGESGDDTSIATNTSETIYNTTISDVTPGATVSESIPQTNMSESIPQTNITESIPQTNITESIPQTNITESIPQTNITESIPQTNITAAIPQTNITAAIPQTNITEAIPQTNITEAIPQTNITEAIPQTNITEAIPQTNITEAIPQTNITEAIPQTNITEAIPQTNITEDVITVDTPATDPVVSKKIRQPSHQEGNKVQDEIKPSSPSTQTVLVDEEETVTAGKCHRRRQSKEGVSKKDWSLDASTEEDLLEWLKTNSYLWLRSKKGYKQKRAAWEIKAKELGISVDHLEMWWRGIKDWYVKISKKSSGQASKILTERETWVLKNCGFYKGAIPNDSGNPLVPLSRVPSAASTGSCQSQSDADNDNTDNQAHVLEDMESTAFDNANKCTTNRKRDKRRREESQEEEESWMRDLRTIMKTNQTLLEKLVQERPQTDREPFVRYVADTLRTASQERYDAMKDLIFDIVRDGRGPSTASAQTVTAPQTCTASEPFHQQFRQQTSQSLVQPSSYQSYVPPHNVQQQQNWQYGSYIPNTLFPPMRQSATVTSSTSKQFCSQQPNYPLPQQPLQNQVQQEPFTSVLNTPLLSQSTLLQNTPTLSSPTWISSLLHVPSLEQSHSRQGDDQQEDPIKDKDRLKEQ